MSEVPAQEDVNLQWSPQLDTLLANWCDQAKCFEWMHNETSNKYNRIAKIFLILMTTITGFSGGTTMVAGDQSIGNFKLAWFFGVIGIGASIIHVLNDKLAYQQNAQAHKIYCSQWGHIRRQMETEVILPYGSRKDATSFLKMIRSSIDQVSNDGVSLIPKKIREECAKEFSKQPNFNIPDICGNATHTQIYSAVHSTTLSPTGSFVGATTPLLHNPKHISLLAGGTVKNPLQTGDSAV